MIRRTLPTPLPLGLEAAAQAALDERREVLADPEVERVLTERPEALGPLIAWLATLAVLERVAPAAPRSRSAGRAAAAGLLTAAGLLVLATRISSPGQNQPPRAPTPRVSGLELKVHRFSIAVTHTGPTGTTQLVNENGHLSRIGEWEPATLAQANALPTAIHVLRTHTSRKRDLQ